MVGFVRGLILVLTSLAAAAGVIAIKRAAVWSVNDWSPASKEILATALVGPAVLYLVWLHLLRPVLLKRRLRRQHRPEDPRVGQRAIGHRTGDR